VELDHQIVNGRGFFRRMRALIEFKEIVRNGHAEIIRDSGDQIREGVVQVAVGRSRERLPRARVAGVGELTDANTVGLQAAWLSVADASHARVHVIRRSSLSEQPLDITLSIIDWDGKSFHVDRRTLVLPAESTSIGG